MEGKMKKLKFYKCKICGNVVIKLYDSGVPVFCCGQQMEELSANTTDGAVEKHKPVVDIDGDKVQVVVGEVLHPMTNEHYISMILIETNKGFYVKNLLPTDKPKAEFSLTKDETFENAYAYCNLHGLWGNR